MAKKKSYPKQPKANAALKSWQKYYDRCKEVDKFNANLESEKKKKEAVKTSVSKLKAKRK